MRYSMLGSTDMSVSALAYGASPLGGVFGAIDEQTGIAAVHTALDLGINFIDVSPAYGETVAETVLGRALRGVDRSSYYLATKVGRYGTHDFDFSAQRVTRSVDESLARLGVEHVDLIQAHDIEFGDLSQVLEETVPALKKVVEAGKARFIGVTGYPLRALAAVSDAAQIDTVLSYCRLTLADTSLRDWLPTFTDRGTGVINASPLAMGALTTRGAPRWHPGAAAFMAACRRAAEHCERRGSRLEKLALQYSASASGPATTIVGTAAADNITCNVEWLTEAIDDDLLAEVLDILAPIRGLTWPTGREENADTDSLPTQRNT